jgi:alkylation response protein AidB-like acyl-CoA dehydrogenase
MDFSLSEEQEATRSLARQILTDLVTPERHKELEAQGQWLDRKAWSALADAGLLGIAAPEAHGGSGLGFLEVALVLEEIGRTVAKVPYLPSVVLGILPIAEFGSEALQRAWLPRLVSGEAIATTALVDVGGGKPGPSGPLSGEPGPSGPLSGEPGPSARKKGSRWVLDGTRTCVPAGLDASLVLVPAMTGNRKPAVFAVETDTPAVRVERQDTTTGIPEAVLELEGAEGTLLGDTTAGAAIIDWITLRATAALAAIAVGVCDAALRITADYTKTREQFGRPIATFQAVGQRAADAYIDTEAVRLTALQAAWRIAEDLPAEAEVAIAKFWAADGGQRVVHAAQHLHGGMGVDRDYPVHRYFLWAKHLELTLGGATQQLLRLGDILAG